MARAIAAAPAGACIAVVVAITGCSSMSERERGTAQGAGVGAVAGAVLGSVTGGSATRGAVIGGAVGAVAGNLWSKRLQERHGALEQRTTGTGVGIDRTTDNRLRVKVPTDVSFAEGRADIRPEVRSVLDETARSVEPNMRVSVVGHTDASGRDAANQALSRERAQAVRNYLIARGVNPNQIDVQWRGDSEPQASNDTTQGRAANRRVEVLISDPAS